MGLDERYLNVDAVERREYQWRLAEEASLASSLLVLPTALGKTIIACLVIADKLAKSGGHAVILAPTRPLAEQHARTVRTLLKLGEPACLTGAGSSKRRSSAWATRRVVVATPQLAVNDLEAGYLPDDVSIVVFDEAHRAVGDYSYVAFAAGLRKRCPDVLALGLTASPGHEEERIREVCDHLGLTKALIRTREDPDVAPYVQQIGVEWVEVQPSEIILKISELARKYLHERLNQLRKYGFLRNRKNTQARIQDLNAVTQQVMARRKGGRFAPYLFQASRQASLARMAMHLVQCVEREGVDAFRRFLEPKTREGRTKLDASLMKDARIQRALKMAQRWKGPSHPKIEPLMQTIAKQMAAKSNSKIIVFAELRDTVDLLVGLLADAGHKVERFTGQASRLGNKGMTQKEQRRALDRFGVAEFNVLVATSIAEEGLDVPQVDLVVFYEPVASDIRLVQRSGRTGRDAAGRVVTLTTDRTIDEAYLYSGLRRERRMRRLVKRLSKRALEPAKSVAPPSPRAAEQKSAAPTQTQLTEFR